MKAKSKTIPVNAEKTARPIEICIRYPRLQVDRDMLRRMISALDENAERFIEGIPQGELSIVFMSDQALAKLHGDFLDDPSRTDVITFAGDSMLDLAGEVCVSVDTALRFSREHGVRFNDELTLYVVHGCLHLAGYDDLKPKLKRAMRRAEARAMKLISEEKLQDCFKLKRQRNAGVAG